MILPDQPPTVGHPSWCPRQHTGPLHTADVGAEDIELAGGPDLSVNLYQLDTEPVQVWLCSHSHDETTVTALTPAQAGELARRLFDAAVLARGPVPPPPSGGDWTDTGSGPGWTR